MGKEPSVTSPPPPLPLAISPRHFLFSYLFLFPSFRRVFRRAPFFPLRLPAVVFFARARSPTRSSSSPVDPHSCENFRSSESLRERMQNAM